MLELESGSNDPMAYLLTIMLISFIQLGEMSLSTAALSFTVELALGTLLGLVMGKLFLWIINKVDLVNESFYPILLLGAAILTFAFTNMIHGNGYLAVYIAGLVIGNTPFVHKRRTRMFFEGFTWLFQIVMFLTLGLLVNPRELLPVAGVSIGIGIFMILIARPLAVFASLLPFKKSFSVKGKIYLSWVGLRGAVPIIFAIYPLTANIEHAHTMFNVVFFITIISLLLQGTTVVSLAEWLNLTEKVYRKDVFGIELPDEIKSAMSQIDITPEVLQHGNKLMELTLPDHTLAVMVMRDNHYFIPKGNTPLQENDKLLVISDNDEALLQAYQSLGIKDYTRIRN
jgi:cell volume regulation protein A